MKTPSNLMTRFLRLLALCLSMAAGISHAATAAPAPVPAAPLTVPAAVVSDYRLGGGDILHITVYQNPDLTLDVRLSDDGRISFPLLGSIHLGGLTVPQAESLIETGLTKGGFIKNPQVTLVLTQVRGSQVSVLGQVNRAGRFPLESSQTRLSDVIAMAGGVTAMVGSDNVVVVGTRDGKPMRLVIDLPRLFLSSDRAGDIVLQNNDVVWVDRAPVIYIYGEVQHPGPIRLEHDMTLLQALAAGGGLTQRGTEKGIRVHRRSAADKVDVLQPGMDETLRDGDVVFVRESLF